MENAQVMDWTKRALEMVDRIKNGGAEAGQPPEALEPGNQAETLQDSFAAEEPVPEEPVPEELPVPPALAPVWMSPEDWNAMERAAAGGEMPQLGADANRRMLHFTLLGLYAGYRAGLIPLGMAKIEKKLAIEAYNAVQWDRMRYLQNNAFYKSVEAAVSAYALEPGPETAEQMFLAVRGGVGRRKDAVREIREAAG